MKKGTDLVIHWHKRLPAAMAYVMMGRVQDLKNLHISCFGREKSCKEAVNVIGSFENHKLPLFLQIIVALDPCRPSCLHFPLPAL